jgi:phosphotriesterase-related protein
MPGLEVTTVLGPIAPEALGVTQPHEHLLVDLFGMAGSYDTILDDVPLAIAELSAFHAAGGRAIVDTTTIGIGRDPRGLAEISRATGVQIVTAAGWYRERVYTQFVWEHTADRLAEVMVRELNEGIDDTGIRAGVIGELGTERWPITPAQERVFRAAARAQAATGVAITTHTSHYGELGEAQLDLLMDEGVPADRVVIGHQGDRRHLRLERPLLARGATVQIDHIGFAEYQPDEQRADHVAQLIADGFASQVLISSDVCMRSHLHLFGGTGYDHLLRTFVPMLLARGATEEEVARLMIENPRRIFARPAPATAT